MRHIEYRQLVACLDSKEPAGANLVAMYQGKLVGSLGLRLHEPGGFIHSFFVDPAFEAEDVATQLLYEASLVCLNYKKPTLGALVPAGPPARLYEDLGFRPYELRGSNTHYITLLPLLQRQEVTFREYNQH